MFGSAKKTKAKPKSKAARKPGKKRGTIKGSTRKTPAKSGAAKRTRTSKSAPKTRTKKAADKKMFLLSDRTWRYLAQQLAPYWTAIGLGATAALAVTLWASGVFSQMGQSVARQVDETLIERGLTIENVEVTGRVFTSKAQMKASLRLESLVPFMKYDIDAARARIEALDWVERATILRLWPNTVRVSLVEKRPIAIWQMNGMFSLIDRKGEVISSEHLTEFSNLPQLVGEGAAEAAPEFVDLLSRFPVLNSRLRAALRIGDRRWTLRLDNGLNILLPDEGEEDALKLLVALDEKYRLLARQLDVIDLRDKDMLFLKLQNSETVQLDLDTNRT